jgi:RNA polymerase I-specific transcription initiation factor RRN3
VAGQFARVAHATGFMYVFPLLNAPPPTTARTKWQNAVLPSNSNSFSALSELTSFFPFDPYKLPRSSSYIEPIYREWASVAIEGDEDDDDDDEEDEAEEDGMQVGHCRSQRDAADHLDVEADGLGASFGGMSISPAFNAAVDPGINSAVV